MPSTSISFETMLVVSIALYISRTTFASFLVTSSENRVKSLEIVLETCMHINVKCIMALYGALRNTMSHLNKDLL